MTLVLLVRASSMSTCRCLTHCIFKTNSLSKFTRLDANKDVWTILLARSVTGGGRRILRLCGLVVGQRLEANNAYGNISKTVRMLYRISPVRFDPEGAVGREQGLFFMGHEGIFLQRLEVLAVGRYRNTPQRTFLIINLYTC
jgi:hypothetical protein